MDDQDTPFVKLKKEVLKFAKERGWGKYHTPKNLASSIVLEAAELLENFQWDKSSSAAKVRKDSDKMENIKKELADVIIYCINLANKLGIDISKAVIGKLEYNKKKFPVEHFNRKVKDLEHYEKVKAEYRNKIHNKT